MDLPTALNIVKQVGAKFQGNLDDHQNIQNAIMTIETALFPPIGAAHDKDSLPPPETASTTPPPEVPTVD